MADPYANLAASDRATQEAIADAMQARAEDPEQIALRRTYLAPLKLPPSAVAVEFGSGTGDVTRDLVDMAGAATAIGIEPGPVMVERAEARFAHRPDLSFRTGDAAETGIPDRSVDLVAMHTLLCHAPRYEAIVAEAFRILRPGGLVAVFDGDYDTANCAIGAFDPLNQVLHFMIDHTVTNRWIARELRPLLARHGFAVERLAAHAYLAGPEPAYFRSVIDRGLAVMQARGLLSELGAAGLAAEMAQRIATGRFFGFMSYVSAVATKPRAAA